MEMQQIIEQAEENIRQALEDYGKHTCMREVLDDVSDDFITQLAHDSSIAKQGLRELFSKSPVWDEKLDALVINGTRTHDKDYNRIRELAFQILCKPYDEGDYTMRINLDRAIAYFATPNLEEYEANRCLESIKALAPKAYQPNRKPSKIFRAICVALGVADDTAGSQFQRLYAQLADEMTSKRISFKLYVSINPAHFLTMSNPKGDNCGQTMTSCHSFNATDYQYNNGCSGYARDEVTFIVFTVDDPMDAESLNNRKTTRQIFAYRPGSGLLMQSRMYEKAGGVYGTAASESSKLYRDLVQREISMLEDVPNLWTTSAATKKRELVDEGYGFGGYADWTYEDFDGHISIRNDCDVRHVDPLVVGTFGLCIKCGREIQEGLYCWDCKHAEEYCCDDCGDYTEEEFTTVYDRYGDRIEVCRSCLDDHYIWCDRCNEYHHMDNMTRVGYNWYCNDCLTECCEECEECGEWFERDDMTRAYNENGDEVWVCDDCLDEHYFYCHNCGNHCHENDCTTITNEYGEEVDVCTDCAHEYTEDCPHCGYAVIVRPDGTCPHCGELVEEETTEEKEAVSA